MSKTQRAKKGPLRKEKESFDQFFSRLYGKDRWMQSLQPSMTVDAPKVALINRYSRLEVEPMVQRKVKMLSSGLSQAALMRAAATGTVPETLEILAETKEQNNNNTKAGGSQDLGSDAPSSAKKNAEQNEEKKQQQQQKEEEQKPFYENLPPLQEYRLTSGIRYVAPPQEELHHQKYKRFEFPPVDRDEYKVPGCYLLDLASLLVVDALHVEPFHKVCDMCAAPGGKSCAIGQIVCAPGELTANEPDGPRRARLSRVLQEYLGPNVPFKVAARDATTWYQPDYFDRVLVDAPCGSERHLIHQHATNTWSNESANNRAKTQTSLLLRAFETVKVGGRVVYSTCSIHPAENDGVVSAALDKCRNKIKVDRNVFVDKTTNQQQESSSKNASGLNLYEQGEPTECGGILLLPDRCNGHGPMFICAFTRLEGKKSMGLTSSDDEEEDEDDE